MFTKTNFKLTLQRRDTKRHCWSAPCQQPCPLWSYSGCRVPKSIIYLWIPRLEYLRLIRHCDQSNSGVERCCLIGDENIAIICADEGFDEWARLAQNFFITFASCMTFCSHDIQKLTNIRQRYSSHGFGSIQNDDHVQPDFRRLPSIRHAELLVQGAPAVGIFK